MPDKGTSFTCEVCNHNLNTEEIKKENKYDIDVAYIICPECDNRFNVMFDNKNTVRIKRKIRKARDIQHYLQLQLYREMLIVEDDYYRQTYNDLPEEDKERIGGYQSNIDKQKIKEYNEAIKSKQYNIKDLMQLL